MRKKVGSVLSQSTDTAQRLAVERQAFYEYVYQKGVQEGIARTRAEYTSVVAALRAENAYYRQLADAVPCEVWREIVSSEERLWAQEHTTALLTMR